MQTDKIYQGDALNVLKTFPNESVNCVMTSPPYWALRDYNMEGQLGIEPTFDLFIKNLCDVFDEVKRVLRKDGTCWINLGDTYSAKTKLPDKSLCMIPQRFAIGMINRGWILRNTIIWHKPNCMPDSVKDRFTVDFEYLFFFTKSKRYYFEQQREPHKEESLKRVKRNWNGHKEPMSSYASMDISRMCGEGGRNKRCVWSICPQPFPEAHFATYPRKLCEVPIKAGCPKEGIVLDPFIGSGTTGIEAIEQCKKFVGIELNPKYIEIAEKRLKPFLQQTRLSDFGGFEK